MPSPSSTASRWRSVPFEAFGIDYKTAPITTEYAVHEAAWREYVIAQHTRPQYASTACGFYGGINLSGFSGSAIWSSSYPTVSYVTASGNWSGT